METQQIKDDLDLKDLDNFTGTEGYTNLWNFNLTDGIAYVMKNGYSWFITDMLAVVRTKEEIKNEDFLSITLVINKDKTAIAKITDGNAKVLYKQEYKWTNGKKNLNLYLTNNVLMLSQEYWIPIEIKGGNKKNENTTNESWRFFGKVKRQIIC